MIGDSAEVARHSYLTDGSLWKNANSFCRLGKQAETPNTGTNQRKLQILNKRDKNSSGTTSTKSLDKTCRRARIWTARLYSHTPLDETKTFILLEVTSCSWSLNIVKGKPMFLLLVSRIKRGSSVRTKTLRSP